MLTDDMEELLSPVAAARIIGSSDCAVTKWCRNGLLPARQLDKGKPHSPWVIRYSDAVKFVKPRRGRKKKPVEPKRFNPLFSK